MGVTVDSTETPADFTLADLFAPMHTTSLEPSPPLASTLGSTSGPGLAAAPGARRAVLSRRASLVDEEEAEESAKDREAGAEQERIEIRKWRGIFSAVAQAAAALAPVMLGAGARTCKHTHTRKTHARMHIQRAEQYKREH